MSFSEDWRLLFKLLARKAIGATTHIVDADPDEPHITDPATDADVTGYDPEIYMTIIHLQCSVSFKQLREAAVKIIAQNIDVKKRWNQGTSWNKLNTLETRYKLPSRHYFMENIIPQMKQSIDLQITELIKDVHYFSLQWIFGAQI